MTERLFHRELLELFHQPVGHEIHVWGYVCDA
jgi:hypothetical protein